MPFGAQGAQLRQLIRDRLSAAASVLTCLMIVTGGKENSNISNDKRAEITLGEDNI